MTDKLIFKIIRPEEWHAAGEEQIYHGSAHDMSDGFLHFSTASQLFETLRLYYGGQDNLVLIAVDTHALGADLKWEHSPSRNQDFPHLFAPLPLSAVTWVGALTRGASGDFVLPALPR